MACIDVTHKCLQEAPMLYCGEEIGTGVDPKVSLPVQEILQLHSRPRWKMVLNCCVLPVLELYDGCWSPPLKGFARDGVKDGVIVCAGGHCCGPLGWNNTCLTGGTWHTTVARSYLMLISTSVKHTLR